MPEYIYIIAEYQVNATSTGTGLVPTGYLKVGRSDDPEKRCKDLQTGNPRPLRVSWAWIVTSTDVKKAEHAAHETLGQLGLHHTGGGTEWYFVSNPEHYKYFMDHISSAIRQYTTTSPPHGPSQVQYGARPF